MKVLQINKFLFHKGGAETYMFQLSKALVGEGIKVKHWGMKNVSNIVNDFPNLEIETVDYTQETSLKSLTKVWNTIYSHSNRKKIAQVLDLYKPDIVHIHNYNFQITPSILPEIKKRGIPIVQTVHDSKMVCPNYRLYNIRKNSVCTKCVTGSFINCTLDRCFDGSFFRSLLASIESTLYHQLDYYNKYIDTFIIPSNFMGNLVKNKITAKKIKIIPNFVDIQIPENNKAPQSEFLFYGRIINEKGVFELFEIFKDLNFQLNIIGTGPDQQKLKNLIATYDNIHYIGAKYNEELFSYVQNASYVIQPAKGHENCPMTVLESFALGVPVIGANHSGFKELISEGETGYLLDFTNTTKSQERLKEIVNQPVKTMKINIKNIYNKKYTKAKHLEKVLQVYQDLL